MAKGEGSWSYAPLGRAVRVLRLHRSQKILRGLDTMGSHWLLGIAEVRGGEIQYITRAATEKVSRGRYVIWIPAWSIVHSGLSRLDQRMECIVGTSQGFSAPDKAFIARIRKGSLPQGVDDVGKFVSRFGDRVEIEFNPFPSALSKRAKVKIDRYFKEGITISAIAEQLRTSATVLGRAFKQDFGITPVEYRNHLRVTHASFALAQGKDVTRVASDMGFNDLGRFNKNFKAVTRTQPRQFKAKKSKNAKL
ncbi:MAG: helix-turn-helix domain-containing protein [Bdellovibrionia bacterium]